tara:strand:+ start:7266 stop:8417 length:1152 start_codon:yes stop_codon:yes gene_type:complete
MPENIIQPAQLAQGQMVEGEDYEYKQGSYLDELREELAMLRNQYELDREHERENSLLGERNMAILNSALAARGTIQGMRDAHLNKIKANLGGNANSGITYDEESGTWITATGEKAKYINKSKISEPNLFSSLMGWNEGIVELQDGQVPKEEDEGVEEYSDETGVETKSTITANQDPTTGTEEGTEELEDVTSAIQSEKPMSLEYKDMSTSDLITQIDPSDSGMDPELVKEFQRRTGLSVDGKFGKNTTAAWQDAMGIRVDEELGDEKPDEEWTKIEENNKTNNASSGNEPVNNEDYSGESVNVDENEDYSGESVEENTTYSQLYDESISLLKDKPLYIEPKTSIIDNTQVVNQGNLNIDDKLANPSKYELLKKKYPNSILQGY